MTITVDASAVKRIEDLRKQPGKPALMLRVTVDGGGCSGFQYRLELTDDTGPGDAVFGGAVVTDAVSLPYLEGSIVKFKDDLIGSEFVIENPNAVSGCGCGSSFAVQG